MIPAILLQFQCWARFFTTTAMDGKRGHIKLIYYP